MKTSAYENHFAFDLPIEYKGIMIYPILMKDYDAFTKNSRCFLLDKNSIPDIRVISMSNLEYLYNVSSEEMQLVVEFGKVLQLVMRNNDCEIVFAYKGNRPVFTIDGKEYFAEDYDDIRQIICDYNDVDLPNEMVQKEIRDAARLAKEMRARSFGKMGSLEDHIICVMITTSLTLEQIYNLSIRKFFKILQRADFKLHYEIYMAASMSGFVEFKDKSALKHWMTAIETDELELTPIENIEGVVSGKNFTVRK